MDAATTGGTAAAMTRAGVLLHMAPTDPGAFRLNRANWDDRARLHGEDRYYDTDALVAGTSSLTDIEQDALKRSVGDVAGLDVPHLQCHIGFDSVRLARAGARVTGIDFSPASLAKAADLAERCGVEVSLVEAEACYPPPHLERSFDLVYATIGVLGWIDDVGAWMRAVARLLRPGGHLVLILKQA